MSKKGHREFGVPGNVILQKKPCPKYLKYLILQLVSYLYAIWNSMISLSPKLGPLWPKLDHLPQWACIVVSPPSSVDGFLFFLNLLLHLSFSRKSNSLGVLALGVL